MSEQDKAMVRRYYEEVLGEGKSHVIDEITSPDFVDHDRGNETHDRDGVKRFASMAHAAFADVSIEVEDIIAGDDRVVARTTISGTHSGEFMGILATGRRVKFTCIDIMRCVNGKIVEHWGEGDDLGMLQQLGVIPMPTAASEDRAR